MRQRTTMPSGRRGGWPGLGLAVLLLAGCASPHGPSSIEGRPVDASRSARGQDSRVQYIVLHYTNEDGPRSLDILTGPQVSSHYLVGDEPVPVIHRLVGEDRRAWHAGVSAWAGQTQLNAASIGIEIVNAGDHRGPDGQRRFAPYPDAQVDAVIALVRDIARRHGVRPDRVVGHSDIAPQRKVDPGPLFPWHRLAEAGLVRWPDPGLTAAARERFAREGLPDAAWFQRRLARHGFDVPATGVLDTATRRVVTAFQMKYRPARHDGEPDVETAALLAALTDAPVTAP